MDYYERKKKRNNDFKKKFAQNPLNGSYKLTASGCFDRHNTTRDEQNMTQEETVNKERSGWNHSEYSERKNLEFMRLLIKFGEVMRPTETMEEFVERGLEEGLIIDETKERI